MELRPSTAAMLLVGSLIGLFAYLWPFVRPPHVATAGVAHSGDALVVMLVLLPVLLLLMMAELSSGGLDARAVGLLAVLTGFGAALRLPGAGVSGFSPMFFLVILAGYVLGPGFGFVLGATTMFGSAIITGGMGPWLPFQMLGLAWIGAGAGLVPSIRSKRSNSAVSIGDLVSIACYSMLAGFAYGFLLNLWFWPFAVNPGSDIAYVPGEGLGEIVNRYMRFYVATSLGWDLTRAVGNLVLVTLLGRPIMIALRRSAARSAFVSR